MPASQNLAALTSHPPPEDHTPACPSHPAVAAQPGPVSRFISTSAAPAPPTPQEFLDPITFACMADPVLLCGTGQVYCLRSLRAWLQTGSRTCPKTNMTMRDVEVGAWRSWW